jgi:hypothetical protein
MICSDTKYTKSPKNPFAKFPYFVIQQSAIAREAAQKLKSIGAPASLKRLRAVPDWPAGLSRINSVTYPPPSAMWGKTIGDVAGRFPLLIYVLDNV